MMVRDGKIKKIETAKGDILLVDDSVENLSLLSCLLTEYGYTVRSVTSGEMALKTLNAQQPDAILLDIKMPDMDGYEVCSEIKKDENLCDIPIIFLSALTNTEDKLKAFACGGADYITKSYQIEEIAARLENQLTIYRQRIALQREIEKRRDAEEVLYQSRALLSSVLNSSLDGIAALQAVRDPQTGKIEDFRCLVVNPVISKAFNRRSDQLIGKLLLKKFLRRINPEFYDQLILVVETGQPLVTDLYYPTGESFWYHCNAVKLGDGFAIVVRDVTVRKRMELELQIANRELRLLANADGLTKISNRRCFDDYLIQEWCRLSREQQPLSLLMIDIDCFKRYNDYYGHQNGDECLRKIAQTIQKMVARPADLVARYGGEEFVIVLPYTNEAGAVTVAQRIHIAVHALALPHQVSDVTDIVTVSIGIVSTVPIFDFSPDYFIDQADQALYLAKQQGRNQTCIYLE